VSSALILVVDDNESGRFAKVQMLRRAGYRVIESGTGGGALESVQRDAPDIVILDVNLPDISGMEVSRRLRERGGTGTTLPILQVSSTATSPSDHVQGLEHGADVYLTEPLHPDVLLATVRALVRAHRAERALAAALERERQARTAAEEANAAKNDFIATLSHELRTPLNALLGSVWQLRHTGLDDAARLRALERIERNANAQGQLINDLLDLARIANRKLTLKLRLVNVTTILRESVDIVRPAATQRGLTLEMTAETAEAIADPGRLQQVFVNLLTNAVQFTPAGGRITVSLRTQPHDLEVRIDDTGAGIDAAFLPFVFEQLRQGEGGLSRKHGGLGLGLSVVRQLVELLDGHVSVSSAGRERGTSFSVTLPREQPGRGDAQSGPLALANLNVVLVDRDMPSEMSALLETAGARLQRVESVAEAVSRLPGIECDAIVGLSSSLEHAVEEARDQRAVAPIVIRVAHDQQPSAAVRELFRLVSDRTRPRGPQDAGSDSPSGSPAVPGSR
jgi:signal transduction histidine kinase